MRTCLSWGEWAAWALTERQEWWHCCSWQQLTAGAAGEEQLWQLGEGRESIWWLWEETAEESSPGDHRETWSNTCPWQCSLATSPPWAGLSCIQPDVRHSVYWTILGITHHFVVYLVKVHLTHSLHCFLGCKCHETKSSVTVGLFVMHQHCILDLKVFVQISHCAFKVSHRVKKTWEIRTRNNPSSPLRILRNNSWLHPEL